MEKKKSEKTLKQNEDYFRRLVQDANSIILRMDIRGRVTFINKFAQKFFGFKEKDILGQSVLGTIVSVTDSAGKDLKAMIQDLVRHPGKYVNNENENTLRSGERVWIAWTNKALSDKKAHTHSPCPGKAEQHPVPSDVPGRSRKSRQCRIAKRLWMKTQRDSVFKNEKYFVA